MKHQGTLGLLILFVQLLFGRCFNSSNRNNVDCNGDQDCHSDMYCSSRKCECDYDKRFDKIKNMCATKVEERCDRNRTNDCVSNAMCDPNQQKCVCHGPNFSKTEGRNCVKNYGMPCEMYQSDCNPEKHLTCRSNTCDCVNPIEMGYSPSQGDGGCVALPDEKCELNFYFESLVKLKCGLHANCANISMTTSKNLLRADIDPEYYGICDCDPGYIRVGSSLPDCMPYYGSSCNLTEPCAPRLHLICDGYEEYEGTENSGVCKCELNANIEILNGMVQPNCVLLEGDSCIPEESICTQNAVCKENSLCQCRFGYSRTPYGHCKLDYDSSCREENSNCNEFIGLKCTKNRCKCSSGQIFDRILKKCVIPVNQACDFENLNSSCPNHAFCDPENGVCICREPMMPRPRNPDGFCYPSFGAPCSSNDYFTSCSGGNYLTCGSQNVCHCNNVSVFEKESAKCYLRAGAKCSETLDFCVSRATCEAKAGIEIRTCECANGYIKGITDGQCGLSYDKFCIPTEDKCSQDNFLNCSQMTKNGEYRCRCLENVGLGYDEGTKSCRSLQGFSCDNESGPSCSENSECVEGIGQNLHVCECANNFIADGRNHRCVPKDKNSLSQTKSAASSIRITSLWSTKVYGRFGLTFILYYWFIVF